MAQIQAVVPTGKVVWQFRALTDFYAKEVESQYLMGQIYHVREGNNLLHELAKKWITENKVEEI